MALQFQPIGDFHPRRINYLGAACTAGEPGYIDGSGYAQPATASTAFDFVFAETKATADVGNPVDVYGPEVRFRGFCSGTLTQAMLGTRECDIEDSSGWKINEDSTTYKVVRILEVAGIDTVGAGTEVVFAIIGSQLSSEGSYVRSGISDTIAGLTVTGALNANGGIACDTNKFTVADSTGNTAIAGTLGVTGATTITGALAANGGITVDSTAFVVSDTTGNVSTAGTLGVTGATTLTGALAANGGITVDSTAFTVADTSGNVATAGTLDVTGLSSLDGGVDVSGETTIDGTTGAIVGGATTDITINTDKLTVAAATGNTAIGGTLAVTGATTLTGGVTGQTGAPIAYTSQTFTNPVTNTEAASLQTFVETIATQLGLMIGLSVTIS